MRTRWTYVVAVALVALVALPAAAQNPSGTLKGRVLHGGDPLPGVTVTVQSPALQGTRTAITTGTGDFILPFLPPGTYQVSFDMPSFRTANYEVKISAAQERSIDVNLELESFEDVIEVQGAMETISAQVASASTYSQDLIEQLPVARTMESAVLLTPGVQSTGPGGNIAIAGAMSFENLFLINGVVVNENLRGQPFDLFIEDAIEETTTTVSGVSAQYGRFSGGVVNMITKSGGNEFSGSFRVNMTNDDWISQNHDLSAERVDDISQMYEATLGGFIVKDRLWFFGAGRDEEFSEGRETRLTLIPYSYSEEETRYEAKLTFSLNPSHRVVGSYIDGETAQNNRGSFTFMDLASLSDRTLPSTLMALNYTGVFSENLFLEAQYSEREFSFVGGGSPTTDLIGGTLLLDRFSGGRYHTPTFCSAPECGDERRDNENILVKGTYFVTSDRWGSHEIVAGVDSFTDIRNANNHQQGSDFRIYGSGYHFIDGEIYPIFDPISVAGTSNGTYYRWTPIFLAAQDTDFVTDSVFVNDTWRLNDKTTFNLGVRYDRNDGTDSEGKKVVDDSKISPRLGVSYDVTGDGTWIVNASYGHYVSAIANSIADSSSMGGQPAWTLLWYDGPQVNVFPSGYTPSPSELIGQDEAIAIFFEWFNANGGVGTLPGFSGGDFPGLSPQIASTLSSPHSEEYSVGLTRRLGQRGLVRADYVHRQGRDFYVQRKTIDTGTATSDFGPSVDVGIYENDDSYAERVYDGLHTQFQYRFTDRISVGGNWTWSHARGTVDGETASSGPVTLDFFAYPEYRDLSWNAPRGDLDTDRRHQARLYGVWNAITSARHSLSVSLLQNFWSGTPYDAVGSVNPSSWVSNPGYLTPPRSLDYYFSGRGEYRWDDVTRTDMSLNYSFFLPIGGQDFEFFLQPEVLNLFNEDAQIGGYTSVRVLGSWDPFTTTPEEGVHWEKRCTSSYCFGDPTGEGDIQAPRTFRMSFGIRF